MVNYNCNLCNFNSKIKSHYERHLNTNKHKKKISECDNNLPQLTSINLNLPQLTSINLNDKNKDEVKCVKCKYCNNQVSYKNLRRHYRTTCIEIPKKDKENLIDKYNNHKKTTKTLALINNKNNTIKTINTNNNNSYNTTHTNSHNTTNNNIQNNITLKINPLGKEDISFLTEKDKLKILSKRYMGVPELIKMIHDNPSNHNFYLPNVNKKVMAYLNGENKLEYEHYNLICNQIVDDNIERFDKFFNELGDKLNNTIKPKVDKVVEDNNSSSNISNKYIEDIKFYLMNRSKEYKKDITDYVNKLSELIEKEKLDKENLDKENLDKEKGINIEYKIK